MESIYRNTIMKKLNKAARGLCLSILLLGLCILPGCGEEQTEDVAIDTAKDDTHEKKDFQREVEDRSENDENDQDAENPEEQEDSDAAGPITMAQLLKEMDDGSVEEDVPLPSDTVLWFNATYAPLTASNAGDWRLVGGMEPSSASKRLLKSTISRDWDVDDRESALETLDWLRDEGHRETYRNYQEELEDLGMLDMEPEDFVEALLDTEMDGYLFRYVMIYDLYLDGLDEEAIAAWDLCRINQLCGDFYICGYMTYEEAMDISLKNSLVLQDMFSSWEDMVDSYMLGYQFWKSDPAMDDDSPTMQRYHYYEQLCDLDDGPYTLDWDMKFEKDW